MQVGVVYSNFHRRMVLRVVIAVGCCSVVEDMDDVDVVDERNSG